MNSLKIAFVNIKEHPHGLGARKFADIVAEKSGGKITASIPLTLTHISLEQLRSSYSSQIWQLAGVEQENGDAGRCALLGRDTVRVG